MINILYKVNCKDCDKTYIGHAKQQISRKIVNHMNDYRNIYMINRKQKWILSDHAKNLNADINLQNKFFLEMINIVQHKNIFKKCLR